MCATPHKMTPQLMEAVEFGLFSYTREAKVESGASHTLCQLVRGTQSGRREGTSAH